MRLSARSLTEADQKGVCQRFECGGAPYQQEVAQWIRRDLWMVMPEFRGTELHTVALIDHDEGGRLVGFASWGVVDDDPRRIELIYFGVHSIYQRTGSNGPGSCSDRLLKAVLDHMTRFEPAAGELPVTLLCHRDNCRARKFFKRHGFQQLIAGVEDQACAENYVEMVLPGLEIPSEAVDKHP